MNIGQIRLFDIISTESDVYKNDIVKSYEEYQSYMRR